MNKFVFTALATTLVSATSFATEADWPELDRELEALSSTLNTQDTGGPQLSGWVIVALDFSSDVQPNGADDLGGAQFRSIRLNVAGSTADYGYKVSTDLVGGTATLLDAWGQLNFTESFSMRIGNYKTPFLASQMRARKRELLLDRTVIGGGLIGTARDAGLMFFGTFAESIGWWLSAQNGIDGASDGMNITARLAWDAMGEGAGQKVDGAYNAGDGTNMTFAIAYNEDMSDNDAGGTPIGGVTPGDDEMDQVGAEAYITSGPFYIGGEILSRGMGLGDNSPWDVTASYLFNGDWEAALRYEDHDDDPTIITGDMAENTFVVGLNHYVSGHDVKWQFQYRSSSFTAADDLGIISLGLVVAF